MKRFSQSLPGIPTMPIPLTPFPSRKGGKSLFHDENFAAQQRNFHHESNFPALKGGDKGMGGNCSKISFFNLLAWETIFGE